MKRNTARNLKLGGLLTGLVTASIGITAFSLPQFNSMDSYLFTPTNWTQSFVNRETAIDFLNDPENDLFREDQFGSRIVNEFMVEAAFAGINKDYFSLDTWASETFTDEEGVDAEEEYAKIKQMFIDSITSDLIDGIITKAVNVHVPTSELVSNGAFTSTSYSHDIDQYFKGLNGESFLSAELAFNSLIDQSQIVFEYNGTNYNTISEVVIAWMTDEGFIDDSAYKEVVEHIRWEASGTYIDSNSKSHLFNHIDTNVNNTDEAAFKNAAQAAFSSQMRIFEEQLVTEKQYTETEWQLTTDYANSRDAWLADPANNNVFEIPVHRDLQNNTMGNAFGWYEDGSINGPGEVFFPTTNNFGDQLWQGANDTGFNFVSIINDELTTEFQFATLALTAWLTPDFENTTDSTSNFMKKNTNNYCSSSGVSLRSSDAWKSWTAFAEYMGFDEIEIPNEDRLNVSANTVNKWWEPDCEGVYVDRNLHNQNDNSWGDNGKIDWFSDQILNYFNHRLNPANIWKIDAAFHKNNDVHWPNGPVDPQQNGFTFTSKSNEGAITGKTMMEALLEGGGYAATEADYLNTATDYAEDYLDWVNAQDFIYFWNSNEYRGRTEALAKASLDSAIQTKIESEWINIIYNKVESSSFSVQDHLISTVTSLDSSFVAHGYSSIEEARAAVKNVVQQNGASNIWSEQGIVTFIADSAYGFDTSTIYTSIDHARDGVDWYNTVNEITSAYGQTGSYDALTEYSKEKIMKLAGFNGTTTDILFDMSINQLASKLVEGYDLSSLDSTLVNIQANISDAVATGESYEMVSYIISLNIDNYDEDNTTWLTSNKFRLNSEEHIIEMERLRQELIDFWVNELNA